MNGRKQGSEEPSCPAEPTIFRFIAEAVELACRHIGVAHAFIELKFNGSTSELCKLITIRVDGLFCFDALIGGLPGWNWARRTFAPEALAWMILENARRIAVNAKVVRHR